MSEIAVKQGFGATIAAKSSAFSAAKLLIYKDIGGLNTYHQLGHDLCAVACIKIRLPFSLAESCGLGGGSGA